MPGGIELLRKVERHLELGPDTRLLSVACGTGELELYLAEKYGCRLTGVDASEGLVRRARDKAAAGKMEHLTRFEVGDGGALEFEEASFDVLFCSGALCAFFERGLDEFYRLLRPGGRAAISEVVWLTEDVPAVTRERWTEGTAHILTLEGNCQAFAERGFAIVLAEAYNEPLWWEAYYADRGTGAAWVGERDNYRRDREYLGIGLFVIEKRALPQPKG